MRDRVDSSPGWIRTSSGLVTSCRLVRRYGGVFRQRAGRSTPDPRGAESWHPIRRPNSSPMVPEATATAGTAPAASLSASRTAAAYRRGPLEDARPATLARTRW